MGNDGGSIPLRRELVKEAARNPTTTQLKETRQEKLEYNWRHDPLNQQLLVPPIVSDSLGRLLNKDSVLEFLLPSDEENAEAKKADQDRLLDGTIKSLKDIVEVKFAVESTTSKSQRWICPITHKVLGPATKSVYLVPCGHAFSEAAVREVPEDKCLQCNESYAPNDIIPILPIDEVEIARLILRGKSLKERGLAHSLKKASGGKKRKTKIVEDADVRASPKESLHIQNAATASLTSKVMKEQEENNKKRKTAANDNLQSLFTKDKPMNAKGQNNDFMTRGFLIPADAKR